ncbi:MAG: TraB/GumN family protein [Treponema sp.]|nr:TraB/GumN family protein [Treponema sp.]
MKRFIIFCSIILVFAVLGTTSLFAAGIRDAKPSASSVWKVSSENNVMFLAGSIHVLREMDFPLPQMFDHAFYQSDILVLEADVRQMEDPAVVQYLIENMFLPGDIGLHDILEEETYELLASVCLEYGFSIENVSNLKPSMIMNILALFQIEEFGFIQQGVDDYYLNKAKEENLPVKFLESLEDQIDMIVGMGEGYENEYVLYSLLDMSETEAMLEVLVAEWKTGEASATEETLFGMKEQWPEIYKSMITDRHDVWIPQITDYLASGQIYFVIVGLAHIHGPDGLIKQLEDLGYIVEQVLP